MQMGHGNMPNKPLPSDVIWDDELPKDKPMSFGEKAFNVIAPTVELGALTAGGIVGAPLGPVPAAGSAGLAYSGARRLTQGTGALLGYRPTESPLEAFTSAGQDVLTGAAAEMGSQIITPIYLGAKAKLGHLAKKLYESSIKPVPSLPASQREAVLQTGLERAAVGKSYRPKDKHLFETWKEVNSLVQQADDIVSASAGQGDVISLKQLAGSIDDVAGRFKQGPFSKSDISKLTSYRNQLLSKYGITKPTNAAMIPAEYDKVIPAQEALAMKKFIYRMAEKYYNKPGMSIAPAKIEAEKAVARAIKMELEELYPATKALNEEASKLIDFGKVLERATNRTGNRELFNIFEFLGGATGATIAGGPGAVGGGLLSYTVSNPQFKSILAKHIYKASVPDIVKVQMLSQLTRLTTAEALKRTLPAPAPVIPYRQELPNPIGVE